MAKALFSAYLLGKHFELNWKKRCIFGQRGALPILVVLFPSLFPCFCLGVAKKCCLCLSETQNRRQKTRPLPTWPSIHIYIYIHTHDCLPLPFWGKVTQLLIRAGLNACFSCQVRCLDLPTTSPPKRYF